MFIALSLFLPYLFGLGCLAALTAPRLFTAVPGGRQNALQLVAVVLLAGILVNYVLVLVLERLGLSLAVGSVLSVLGLFAALRNGSLRALRLLRRDWIAVCIVLYLALLYGLYIFFDPLSAWDARSIWFFHGKMIFYNQALSRSAGWTDPAFLFSLIEYPKLAAVLAAQFAHVAGFWNEYFPKAALLALLVPALFALQTFASAGRISFFYLLAALLFSLGGWLWNGYMDGYLALYAGLSMLLIGRWLDERNKDDLYAGIVCLGVAISLKNEGLMLVLVTAVVAAALQYTRRDGASLDTPVLKDRSAWLLVVLASLGAVFWRVLKWRWGIAGDALIELQQLPQRLTDGSLSTILDTLLLKNGVAKAFAVLTVALVAARSLRLRMPLSVWFTILTTLAYFLGMVTVYLATSRELAWHLATSSDRTMLLVLLGLLSSSFLLVRDIETADGRNDSPRLKHQEKEKEKKKKKR